MSHLDEGTIHAWLDGALSATQSAEADAHVRGCTECSAKVAEARGLIAASSRILTALDDTPANVIPKPAVAPTRRRRSVTPWISGLAAAAILITVWRTGDVQHPAPMAELRVPEISQVQVPEPSLGPLSQPAPPPARVAMKTDTARQGLPRRVGNVSGAAGSGAVGAAAAPSVAADVATAQTNAPGAPIAPPMAVTAREETQAQRRESFSADAQRRMTETRKDAPTLTGCYLATAQRLEEVVVTGAAESPKAAVRSRAAASASGAPTAVSAQKSADRAMPSVLVRLDSGKVVRRAESPDSVGTWLAIAGDSVRVSFGGRTFVVGQSSKVRCP